MDSARERRKQRLFLAGCLLLGFTVPALAAAKTHPRTAAGQECEECHSQEEASWLSGKHGLMNVKCVVCHGAPEKNFVPHPPLSRCRGCHSDQVSQVAMARNPKERTCFRCHDNHTVAATAAAIKEYSGFHRQGGAQ